MVESKKQGRQTAVLACPPAAAGFASVVGKKEGDGPLADTFDLVSGDDTFGEKSWEKAESAMQKLALARALDKAGLTASRLDCLLAGDLLRAGREQRANEELVRLVEEGAEEYIPAASQQPEAAEEVKPERNYRTLAEQNSDLTAWLTVPGTQLDYPVLYTPQEPEFYLRRAFDGSYAVSGSLFIGAGSAPDSEHVMIYGHYMRNGSMFGSLDRYADPAYWEEHPEITYDLIQPDGSYQRHTYQVMAAFYSRVYRTDETGVFRFYYYQDLSDPAAFQEYVDGLEGAALYDTGVTAQPGDRLLTLITCSYHTDGGRFVVAAREKIQAADPAEEPERQP